MTAPGRCWQCSDRVAPAANPAAPGPGVARLVSHTEPDFLAEVYTRTGAVPISVPQATGLV
jgi:hypothetical protein